MNTHEYQLLKVCFIWKKLIRSNLVIKIVPHVAMSFHHPFQNLVAKHGPCGF